MDSLAERLAGVRVHSLLPVDADFIAVFDYYEASKAHFWANLWRVDAQGNAIWRAEAPHSPDYFLQAEVVGTEIKAWTGACYACRIDAGTGKILESVFTK